jgi:serine/threonine-protein kinase
MAVCKACGNPLGEKDTACPACGTPAGQPPTLLKKGEVFDGKYEVLDFLGAGGMGELYKVKHIHLQDTRAIKIMRATVAQSEADTKRFISEARIATRIQHPSVSVLYDFSQLPTGNFYIVWEYIPGKDISRVLQACGKMPLGLAVRIMRDALNGLDYIHKNGVIHRDISPENLMLFLNQFNELKVKIIDLGIAKSFSMGEHLTQTGMFMGKLKYCSPEQVGMLEEGEQIDGRTDIYSIGLVLYEMVEGRAPFTSTTPYGYIHKHTTTPPTPIAFGDIPGEAGNRFNAVLLKALEKDRNLRHASAREFADALSELDLPAPEESSIHSYLKPVGFETAHITTPTTGTKMVAPTQRSAATRAATAVPPKPAPPPDDDRPTQMISKTAPRPAVVLPPLPSQKTPRPAVESRPTEKRPAPPAPPAATPADASMETEQTIAVDTGKRKTIVAEPTIAAPRAVTRSPVPPSPPVKPGAVPEDDRTQAMPPSTPPRAEAAPPPSASRATSPPPVARPEPRPSAPAVPAPILKEKRPFPKILLLIPIIILAAVAVVFMLRQRAPKTPAPPSPQAQPSAAAGYLSLQVLPWGTISALRNEKGESVPLGDAMSPLLLPLPEGRYTVTLTVGRTSKTLNAAFSIRPGETTDLVQSSPDIRYDDYLAQIR